MVKWLLQNSLGRSYHEIYPDSNLPAAWEYYIKPDQLDTSTTFNLASLTVLDPCMGSGHFLREAFDMFVAMYREQFHTFSATEIADRILSHHLYGIDIDPRAAQLSALTLYLRAWELVRDERRKERKPGSGTYTPPAMNLATTPSSLTEGALQRHLSRHPQDMPLKPLLEGIFAGLEQADILGSLLRPKEYLDSAIAELQRPHTMRLDFDLEEAELRRTITEMANRDPAGLRQMLLGRIADAFKAEASNTDDVGAALFGQEAERGVRLLQMLDQRYAVVVTNPPYMGSKNMDTLLKKYIEKYYPSGKRDLYAAFILRCLELCNLGGRVAMVLQRGWSNQKHYLKFREKLLTISTPEILVDLGPGAFSEISGENVTVFFSILINRVRTEELEPTFIMSTMGLSEPLTIAKALQLRSNLRSIPLSSFEKLPGHQIVCGLTPGLVALLAREPRLGNQFEAEAGLWTGDDSRFIRFCWEILWDTEGWIPITKGGAYRKWYGLTQHQVRWGINGEEIKSLICQKFPYLKEKWEWVVKNSHSYFLSGATYSFSASGSLGVRIHPKGRIFHELAPYITLDTHTDIAALAAMNARINTLLIRTLADKLRLRAEYVNELPMIPTTLIKNESIQHIVSFCLQAALQRAEEDPKEWDFSYHRYLDVHKSASRVWTREAILLTCEAICELEVNRSYNIEKIDEDFIVNQLGTPVGWFPLIISYDTLPNDLSIITPLQELLGYLKTHERINLNEKKLVNIKANLRSLYEAGPGVKSTEQEVGDEVEKDNESEEEIVTEAHIPIPAETFLEELSVKMQLHPISIYWLLEELRNEGVRCMPEEKRLLEDRLSVLVLRLLGHCWPKQLMEGEPAPEWAESSGIITMVSGVGKPTLAELVRVRLHVEDGELGAQQTEALLVELTGLSLEDWLQHRFFPRHLPQFKYRPIAWHLVSTPTNNGKKRRGSSQRTPAFECLLYYHACTGDALARIRTQYVEPLIRAERQRTEDASLFQDEMTSVLAHDHVQELIAFVDKLRFIEEQGFACSELDTIIVGEPLDRWSGDGYLPPANREELLHNEKAWHVDINDGVRVNIAPLQLAGVLASDVLKAVDAKKAIADRARWRADERRWVRDGKLPRCGWMHEQVPESPRWTEREPQRVAEQHKLEQKRLAMQHKQTEEVEL